MLSVSSNNCCYDKVINCQVSKIAVGGACLGPVGGRGGRAAVRLGMHTRLSWIVHVLLRKACVQISPLKCNYSLEWWVFLLCIFCRAYSPKTSAPSTSSSIAVKRDIIALISCHECFTTRLVSSTGEPAFCRSICCWGLKPTSFTLNDVCQCSVKKLSFSPFSWPPKVD